MKSYPFHLVTGSGKGASYSSFRQIGDISPAEPLGQAKVRIFYNIASFNLAITDRALIFPEMKEPVVLGYCFNSQSDPGSSWRLPIKNFTPPDTVDAKQILFTEADGHETTYTLDQSTGQKSYFAPGLKQGTPYLQYDNQNYQWYWYHPGAQVFELYNKYGLLIERRDVWGNKTLFYYDSSNRLQSITGPSGNQYIIERTQRSNGSRYETISIKRPDQPTDIYLQSYEFDKNGLLNISTISLNGQDLTDGYKVQYHYSSITPPGPPHQLFKNQPIGERFLTPIE